MASTTFINGTLTDPAWFNDVNTVTYGIINIKVAGAVGNGITNDYPAFQAAINSLPAAGGRINIPYGTYLLSAIPNWTTKSIYWDIDVGATFTGAGATGTGSFPTVATNQNIVPVGPFIQSKSNTLAKVGDANAAVAFETIQPVGLNGGVIGVFAGAQLNNIGGASIASAANFVATANTASSGNIWGLEIDVATFAGAGIGQQFGLSINGLGGTDITFGIKIDRVDATSKYQFGLDIRNSRVGIYVESTAGIENAIVAGTPPTRFPGCLIQATQTANGGTVTLLQRATNTTPTGYFINAINADNTGQLFYVDVVGKSGSQTHTLAGAASSTTAGTFQLGAQTTSTVGAAGGASALPATPLGYMVAYYGTTQIKIPYYVA